MISSEDYDYLCLTWDVSSVGSERLLHTQEVDSSNLSRPTPNLAPSLKMPKSLALPGSSLKLATG